MIIRCAAAFALLLAGCAAEPPPLSPSPFDATYVGITVLVGFSSPDWHCYWAAPPITVRNGVFHADIDGAPMTVRIADDGSFDRYASRPIYSQTKYETPVHMFGRISDGVMAATVHQP